MQAGVNMGRKELHRIESFLGMETTAIEPNTDWQGEHRMFNFVVLIPTSSA